MEEQRLAQISEAILEAARSITRATATLVQAATVSQKEIIAKVPPPLISSSIPSVSDLLRRAARTSWPTRTRRTRCGLRV